MIQLCIAKKFLIIKLISQTISKGN